MHCFLCQSPTQSVLVGAQGLSYWMMCSVVVVRPVSSSALMQELKTTTASALKMLVCSASQVYPESMWLYFVFNKQLTYGMWNT